MCAGLLCWRQNYAHQSIAGFVILLASLIILLTSLRLASRILVPALDFRASCPKLLLKFFTSLRLVSRITIPAMLWWAEFWHQHSNPAHLPPTVMKVFLIPGRLAREASWRWCPRELCHTLWETPTPNFRQYPWAWEAGTPPWASCRYPASQERERRQRWVSQSLRREVLGWWVAGTEKEARPGCGGGHLLSWERSVSMKKR